MDSFSLIKYTLNVRYTTKTEYGLVALLYMARKPEGSCVTVKEIAGAEHYSVTYIEKIFQKLRLAEIVKAYHGNEGGYVLARNPSEITLKQVIDALEGETFDVFCKAEVREEIVCTHLSICALSPIWSKTKQTLDDLYGSITIEMIAGGGKKPVPSVSA